AAYAVHGGWLAGHDRQVVRVRERRDHAVGTKGRAALQHLDDVRGHAGRDRGFEVVVLAAVDANHDGERARRAVLAAIDFHWRFGGRGHRGSFRLCFAWRESIFCVTTPIFATFFG